jgi:hypothetical protein
MNSYKKIFVPAPAGVVTGGAELLHQLVDEINNNGGNAYVVYSDETAQVPDDYKKYNLKVARKIEDDTQNLIVLNEGEFRRIEEFEKARVGLWWLSVDNFFFCNKKYLRLMDFWSFSRTMFFRQFWNRARKFFLQKTFSLDMLRRHPQVIFNGYQSEYARQFLLRNDFKSLVALGDYINLDYLVSSNSFSKEDAVAYNPKKGFEFTRKLIACAPELDWRPIVGLDRLGVASLLRKCKVYIDFGNHPGKDRLPREAAMLGCAIMTGIRGSAFYHKDIPIPRCYKIDQYSTDVHNVVAKIKQLLCDYDERIDDFQEYRTIITQERLGFKEDVRNIFNCFDSIG